MQEFNDRIVQSVPVQPLPMTPLTTDERGRVEVEWRQAAREGWGRDDARRSLVVRGRLWIHSRDGCRRAPPSHRAPIRVLVARRPGQPLDATNFRAAPWGEGFAKADGHFVVSLGAFPLPVGRTASFTVGLALGEEPPLPQSIATLPIAGPPPLSPLLRAINGTPSVWSGGGDTVLLLRAVNQLHALGKPAALATLRSFYERSGAFWESSEWGPLEPANIDYADAFSLYAVIGFLFEPSRPDAPPLTIRLSSKATRTSAPIAADGLALVDDTPFVLVAGFATGLTPSPHGYLKWAEKFGRLRRAPLRPRGNPAALAQRLLADPTLRKRTHVYDEAVRRQVWRGLTRRHPDDGCAGWEREFQQMTRRPIRWDESRQHFVEAKRR